MTTEQEIRAKAMELAVSFIGEIARLVPPTVSRRPETDREWTIPPIIVAQVFDMARRFEKVILKAPEPIVPEPQARG